MSKRNNYSNYSKPKPKFEPEETPVVQEVEPVIEGQTVIPEVAEPVAPIMATATVANCSRLNVREEPDTSADVLTIIKADTEVQILSGETKNGFYKICTASGIEGYCMCDYLAVN